MRLGATVTLALLIASLLLKQGLIHLHQELRVPGRAQLDVTEQLGERGGEHHRTERVDDAHDACGYHETESAGEKGRGRGLRGEDRDCSVNVHGAAKHEPRPDHDPETVKLLEGIAVGIREQAQLHPSSRDSSAQMHVCHNNRERSDAGEQVESCESRRGVAAPSRRHAGREATRERAPRWHPAELVRDAETIPSCRTKAGLRLYE